MNYSDDANVERRHSKQRGFRLRNLDFEDGDGESLEEGKTNDIRTHNYSEFAREHHLELTNRYDKDALPELQSRSPDAHTHGNQTISERVQLHKGDESRMDMFNSGVSLPFSTINMQVEPSLNRSERFPGNDQRSSDSRNTQSSELTESLKEILKEKENWVLGFSMIFASICVGGDSMHMMFLLQFNPLPAVL